MGVDLLYVGLNQMTDDGVLRALRECREHPERIITSGGIILHGQTGNGY